jgi:carboxyl-terminal processing protease
MTLPDTISRLRGEPGTPVTLLVRRSGREDEFSVTLVRETIRTQVFRSTLEEDVLVLRLSRFTRSVAATIDKAIDDAAATRLPRGVVLDMRGNPGGLLNEAIAVADVFLGAGEIVSLRGRTRGNQRSWKADPAEKLAGVPMVVLVDGASASAAELVAAALQENGRAIVMGQRTYGKGSVQSLLPVATGKGALRLTTALYHGPSGRTVQRTGVGPDVELIAAQAPTGRASRREADRLQALPGTEEPGAAKARIEQARCSETAKDAALACALGLLQAGTIETFVAALGVEQSAEQSAGQ